MSQTDWIKAPEAARLAGCSAASMRMKFAARKIPGACKYDGHWRIRRTDFMIWLNSHLVSADAVPISAGPTRLDHYPDLDDDD